MRRGQYDLLLIGKENKALNSLSDKLTESGFICSVTPYKEDVLGRIINQPPDAIIIEVNGYIPGSVMKQFIGGIKRGSSLPILALIAAGVFEGVEDSQNINDFIMSPYNIEELKLRLMRILNGSKTAQENEIIRCNGLNIDLASCQVTVEGEKVELTFKEYELLKFLVANPGRVYTREALLDKVWGFDYYGGDRTVDVHVRRLRSKIETPGNEYIETVRNIGYRFRGE